ncbi:MAG: DUF167 domain-containing protein [Pirellulales bacterium]|nr:DUF167 domain-containing protein [Pirellulales bacterium]
MTVNLEPHPEGTLLPIRAHAGARRNEILPPQDGVLRVSVTQAPEGGKANKVIAVLLAKALGLRKSEIMLHSGETARRKKFLVRGLSCEELGVKISELVSTDGTGLHH